MNDRKHEPIRITGFHFPLSVSSY